MRKMQKKQLMNWTIVGSMDAQFMQNCRQSQTSEKLVADSMKWGKD